MQNEMRASLSIAKKIHNDPLIKREDTEIPVVKEYKFLGIIFDRKLSFISHIKYLKTKSIRAQQIQREVAHTKWGADRQALLKLYRALVRSKLDHGIFIYKSARKFYLKNLDPIHHEGLRLVLKALRISPEVSLYMENHEVLPQLRCENLDLQYYAQRKSCLSNTAYDCIFNSKYKQQYGQKEKTIKLFCLRMEPILQESAISVTNVHKRMLPQIPPWIIKKQKVILQLNKLSETNTHPRTHLEKIHTIL